MIQLVFVKPCTWRNGNGAVARSQDPEDYQRSYVGVLIPWPVARAAIAAGAAVLAGSDEANRLRHITTVPRHYRINESEYLDLGVNLQAVMDAERARLNPGAAK